jgi:hypothetical protein
MKNAAADLLWLEKHAPSIEPFKNVVNAARPRALQMIRVWNFLLYNDRVNNGVVKS